jgi:hypothetical protein
VRLLLILPLVLLNIGCATSSSNASWGESTASERGSYGWHKAMRCGNDWMPDNAMERERFQEWKKTGRVGMCGDDRMFLKVMTELYNDTYRFRDNKQLFCMKFGQLVKAIWDRRQSGASIEALLLVAPENKGYVRIVFDAYGEPLWHSRKFIVRYGAEFRNKWATTCYKHAYEL